MRGTGAQRLDKVEPIGKELRIARQLETLDGKALDRPIRVGEVIAVRLKVTLEKAESYVMVEDRRPTGCEFADEHLDGVQRDGIASKEFRDDRVCLFFTALGSGDHEIIYYLRAETPGLSHLLPGMVYPMYADTRRGETGSAKRVVER